MNQRQRKLALTRALTLAAVLGVAASAASGADPGAEIVFGTATEGRAYWSLAQRFKRVAAESGLTVEVVETQGSLENLRRLADPEDPVNLILTQADAMQHEVAQRPQVGALAEIVESIGLECIFAITAADGAIATEQDWHRADSPRVAVQAPESGVAVTHRYLGQLIPELADDAPVYVDLAEAMRALHAEGEDRVDVVFQVHRPKFETQQTRDAVAHPDRYRLLALTDERLQAELPNGEDVYEFLDVPLVRGLSGGGVSVPTICTRGLLVSAPAKLGQAGRHSLQRILDFEWMRIYPEESY